MEVLKTEGENPSLVNFLNFYKLGWIGLIHDKCGKNAGVNKKEEYMSIESSF